MTLSKSATAIICSVLYVQARDYHFCLFAQQIPEIIYLSHIFLTRFLSVTAVVCALYDSRIRVFKKYIYLTEALKSAS